MKLKLVVIGLVVGLVLAGCQGTTNSTASPSGSVSGDAAASGSPEPTESPAPSASPGSPEPTDSESGAIAVDAVVATTVEALSVRRNPGADGERIGFLSLGTIGFVLSGPTDVNGVPWYYLTGMGLPYASGCITTPPDQPIACPAYQGWVAGANPAGDPWLAPAASPPCPEPTLTSISESGFTMRLVCWADEDVTFDAWWPEVPVDAGLGGACTQADEPGGFLFCQNNNPNGIAVSPEEGLQVTRLQLSIDPASRVEMPQRGQWIRITGRFDHPAAEDCADLVRQDVDPLAVVFACRLEFVPTEVVALGT